MKWNQVWIICCVKKEKYVPEEDWSHICRMWFSISLYLVQLWCKLVCDLLLEVTWFFFTVLSTVHIAGGRIALCHGLFASWFLSWSSISKLSLHSHLSFFLRSWLAKYYQTYCFIADWEGGGSNKVQSNSLYVSSLPQEIQIQLYPPVYVFIT